MGRTQGADEAASTGVDALVLLLRFHQVAAEPAQIRHQFGNATFGVSEILRCAKSLKLKAHALITQWPRLADTPLPALAECRDGAFVVLGKVIDDKALIQDPAAARMSEQRQSFSRERTDMWAKRNAESLETRLLTPSEFVGAEFQTFFFLGLSLPIAFIILNALRVYVVPVDVADYAIAWLGYIFPILEPQYNAIQKAHTDGEASNYAAFFLLFFLFSFSRFYNAICRLIANRMSIHRTTRRDVVAALVALLAGTCVMILDTPVEFPKPIFNFYVDSFGFYFIRQFALLSAAYLGILSSTASIMKTIDRASA